MPETGAKFRGATPWVLYRGHVGTLLGRWVSWKNSFFRETVGTRVGVGGCSDYGESRV